MLVQEKREQEEREAAERRAQEERQAAEKQSSNPTGEDQVCLSVTFRLAPQTRLLSALFSPHVLVT